MIEALKQSPEPQELKELAKKRIVGIIGDLNQRKRKKQEAKQRDQQRPLQQLPPGAPGATQPPSQVFSNFSVQMPQFSTQKSVNGINGKRDHSVGPPVIQKA